MRLMSFCLAAALAATALSAAAPRRAMQERGEAALAKDLQGLVPGKPERCLMLSRIDGSYMIDGTAIVYRTLGGKLYVNRPLGAASLREDDIPVQYVYGSELCRLDRIKLLDRTTQMERGFVGLGEFVPYTRPAKTN